MTNSVPNSGYDLEAGLDPTCPQDMKKLDSQRALRVRQALVILSTTGRGDVVKLKGVRPPEWRIRVGDQRAFLRLDANEKVINVLRVRRRDRAY